jgi:predicted secreted protein
MKLQDYLIQATCEAAKEAFAYAKAVPADKLDWKPLEAGRSVLDICQEMALCPGWAKEMIEDQGDHEWNEETMAAIEAEKAKLATIEACEAECNRQLELLFEFFRTIPDERLKDTKWLPYDGGRDFTVAEMMEYPKWNFTYHLGQIGYIQTLYGDKSMH